MSPDACSQDTLLDPFFVHSINTKPMWKSLFGLALKYGGDHNDDDDDDDDDDDRNDKIKINSNSNSSNSDDVNSNDNKNSMEVTGFRATYHNTCLCYSIVRLLLPLWLLLQIGMECTDDPTFTKRTGIHWHVQALSVITFVLASFCYSRIVREFNVQNPGVIFLPEASMDFILALVLFQHTAGAILLMWISTLGMSIFVIWYSLHALCFLSRDAIADEMEQV
jgi:hypothetical protein